MEYELNDYDHYLSLTYQNYHKVDIGLLKFKKPNIFRIDFYTTSSIAYNNIDCILIFQKLLNNNTFIFPSLTVDVMEFFNNFNYKTLDCGLLLIDKTSIK